MTADELTELVHRQTEALATLRQQRDAARAEAERLRAVLQAIATAASLPGDASEALAAVAQVAREAVEE